MVSNNALKVLKAYVENAEDDYVYRYSWIEDHAGLTRREAEKAVRELRTAKYLEYVKGLMTEDGEVAGSGHAIGYGKRDDIIKLLKRQGVSFNV